MTETVISQSRLTQDIYDIRIEAPSIAEQAKPGQFVSVWCRDGSRILPRPLSICETYDDIIRLVYRAVGAGTNEFSTYQAGDSVRMNGPLGNGFPLSSSRALLIGGGLGIAPMLELAKRLPGGREKKNAVLGYPGGQLYLSNEFREYSDTTLATEDGSAGVKGNVLDAIHAMQLSGDIIYACGPLPMLRAVKSYAAEQSVPCYLSLEERMACGIGACLGCVCRTVRINEHTGVKNARVCKDGPVFPAEDVEL